MIFFCKSTLSVCIIHLKKSSCLLNIEWRTLRTVPLHTFCEVVMMSFPPFKPRFAMVWGGRCYTQQCSGPTPFSGSWRNGSHKHHRARNSKKLENLWDWLCITEAPFNRVVPKGLVGLLARVRQDNVTLISAGCVVQTASEESYFPKTLDFFELQNVSGSIKWRTRSWQMSCRIFAFNHGKWVRCG